MTTSANPNGSIAIVFTYAGQRLAGYADFLDRFFVTLPGGDGVLLGDDQYVGYAPGAGTSIALGTSYSMKTAATPITGLLPTNAVGNTNLETALSAWAASDAASPGETSYANLYLDHFTGGRIYLSNGDLKLPATGEPVPASPSDKNTYNLVYELFEPYIGAQIKSTSKPGNGADITDIDWFSFPITIKVWYYDFSNPSSTVLTNDVPDKTTIERGGDGDNIYSALKVGTITDKGTNLYPNATPPTDTPPVACRLAGPTAAAMSDYYIDPAENLFPYHYFDTYLEYLATQQGSAESSFTLTGTFAGTGDPGISQQQQQFSFEVDFRNVRTQMQNYASGSVRRITPDSTIVFRGYTFTGKDSSKKNVLGSPTAPFTVELPWAKGTATASLRSSATDDALANGWLSQAAPQTAPSGTYSPVNATACDSQLENVTQLQLIFSVNKNPTQLDDLWQGGHNSDTIAVTNSDAKMIDNAVATFPGDNTAAIIEIAADGSGNLKTIGIHDAGAPTNTGQGSTWTIGPNPGLGNKETIKVELLVDPPLRRAFVLASASYSEAPASLDLPLKLADQTTRRVSLDVEAAGLAAPGWVPDPKWATLDQPAGIYGANTGYTVAGLTGTNSTLNGDVESLQNDVFGWAVADLLAALNVGFVGSPALVPGTSQTIGQSPQLWFDTDTKLYKNGHWGAKAWQDATGQPVEVAGEPVTNFWNTWAYALSTVAGGTDAYGFAFTDRFAEGILLGFNPPPATGASGWIPVLVEVIVDDSPLLPAS